jgi:hypothetical protein
MLMTFFKTSHKAVADVQYVYTEFQNSVATSIKFFFIRGI